MLSCGPQSQTWPAECSTAQIEQDSQSVTIDGAWAENNNLLNTGEAGFWIDEAQYVTLRNCTAKQNHFGICVSQSDVVTIDNCSIEDAKAPTRGDVGGLRVSTGQGITSQPFPRVRNLTVKANCTFSNNVDPSTNNKGDVYYGDTVVDDTGSYTPWNNMTFQNSQLFGSSGLFITEVPWEFAPDNKHEDLVKN